MSNTGNERCKIQNVGDRVDVISQLPDCILHHILSFIPTKDVVKTSILSKRWENLWTSVSNLDFDDDGPLSSDEKETRFTNFVERVLLLRDASCVEKFRLSCDNCCDDPRVLSWISAAIMRNVHELDISLLGDDGFLFPRTMLCSISLTCLKINMYGFLHLPEDIHLPCLKTLHLSLLSFYSENSAQKFFSGCPVLEELVMQECEFMLLDNLTISSSTLKRLTIDLSLDDDLDDTDVCKIMINASNLIYFKYIGRSVHKIFLNDVSSLVKAFISVTIPHTEVAPDGVDLLKGPHTVSNDTKSIVFAGHMPDHLPVFQNLTHLKLRTETDIFTFGEFMKWLKSCPNLQSLYLFEGFDNDTGLVDMWSVLPKCMPSCLKTLTFGEFYGNDSEICFLVCVSQHLLVSNKLNICFENLLGDLDHQQKVRKAVETIARGSESCVVAFS